MVILIPKKIKGAPIEANLLCYWWWTWISERMVSDRIGTRTQIPWYPAPVGAPSTVPLWPFAAPYNSVVVMSTNTKFKFFSDQIWILFCIPNLHIHLLFWPLHLDVSRGLNLTTSQIELLNLSLQTCFFLGCLHLSKWSHHPSTWARKLESFFSFFLFFF